MSKIKLPHASGNSMSIAAPASNPASDLTLTLPTTIGSNGQYMKVDGSGNLGWITPPNEGWVKVFATSTTDGTGVLSVENTSLFDGTYKRSMIVMYHSMPTVDNEEVRFQVKVNGSYQTGNEYAYHWRQRTSAGSSTVTDNSTANGHIPIAENVGNAAGEGWEGVITWSDSTSTTHWKRFAWNITAGKNSGDMISNIGSGGVNGSDANTALTGVKLLMSNGAFGAVHYAGFGLTL